MYETLKKEICLASEAKVGSRVCLKKVLREICFQNPHQTHINHSTRASLHYLTLYEIRLRSEL